MPPHDTLPAAERALTQGVLPSILDAGNPERSSSRDQNKLVRQDRGFHDWYRFVLSFPPHVVREYLSRWNVSSDQLVLDPFCGTGTTVVECKKMGIPSIGVEANPLACFASMTKLNWQPNPVDLVQHAEQIALIAHAETKLTKQSNGLRLLPAASESLLLTNSISPLPLHRLLILRECIDRMSEGSPFVNHERLALARVAVVPASNLKFGPEVGVGPPKDDAPVIDAWLSAIREMAHDLQLSQGIPFTASSVVLGDARQVQRYIEPESISAVFTSPPYPNEKDYSRTTRLEMTLLGFATAKTELQAIKRTLLRSNTRNVYKGDDDDLWVKDILSIQEIAVEIERRRVAMNKTSGFEKLYAKVTKLYFGGMAKHLADLRTALKPGAHLGYVVGDQASYLQVKIRTGEILAEIARQLGYEVVSLDLFRTRLATATREMLREEVLVLRWPLTTERAG